jgi:hypothetical protein
MSGSSNVNPGVLLLRVGRINKILKEIPHSSILRRLRKVLFDEPRFDICGMGRRFFTRQSLVDSGLTHSE